MNDIHSWGIFVKCVTLGNTVYIAKTNFVLNFTEEYFELPKGVFKLLREKYFSSFIRQKKCIENEEHIFSCSVLNGLEVVESHTSLVSAVHFHFL